MRQMLLLATLTSCLLALGTAGSAQDGALLNGSESLAMADTMQHALEHNPSNRAAAWVNPDADRSGSVVPLRTFENAQGQPCREFIAEITIGGRQEQGYGTACRQPDGSWQIVPESREPAPSRLPEPVREVHVYPSPAQYYLYPSGFYGPSSRIFLSFSFVDRDGHRHRGHTYRGGWWLGYPPRHHVRKRVYVRPWFRRGHGGHGYRPWDRRDGDSRRGDRDERGRDGRKGRGGSRRR